MPAMAASAWPADGQRVATLCGGACLLGLKGQGGVGKVRAKSLECQHMRMPPNIG